MNLSKIVKEEIKEFLQLRWQLSKDLLFVLVSYAAVVACFYLAFQVITMENVAPSFILYGPVGLLVLGVLFPVVYNSHQKTSTLRNWNNQEVLVGKLGFGYHSRNLHISGNISHYRTTTILRIVALSSNGAYCRLV